MDNSVWTGVAIVSTTLTGILGLLLAWKKVTRIPPIGEQFVTHAELEQVVKSLKSEIKEDSKALQAVMEDKLGGIRAQLTAQTDYNHEREHSLANSFQTLNNRVMQIMGAMGLKINLDDNEETRLGR